jgi:hypothetical protein
LIAAIVDNKCGDPIRCVYTLIAVAAAMADQLSREDRLFAALEMHSTATSLLPEPRTPMMRNGHQWVEMK